MNSRRFADEVAWISGGTSGIGEATARLFAHEGARVVVVGRREQLCQSIAAQIESSGGRALGLKCDVADELQVQRSIERTIEQFGRLDILINNAGEVDVCKLHEYEDVRFDQLVAVNVKSIFYAFKHAYAHLCKQPRSYVVN